MSLLAERFREQVSKLKDYNMKVESDFSVGYSTGFLSFDFRNGTIVHAKNEAGIPLTYYSVGITDGSMVMIIGRSGCGKTTWTIQAAANIVRPFRTSCIFHDDIEGGINDSRLEQLTGFVGEELKGRYIIRNVGITTENLYQRIKIIYDNKNDHREDFLYDTGLYDTRGNRIMKLEPTVYILDSLALLTPEKFAQEDELSGQMSTTATAKATAMVFRKIVPMLKSVNIIFMVINHITQKVDINPMQKKKAQVSYLKQDEALPGGNTPVYLANNLIRFDDVTKLKEKDGFGIDGSIVDLGLVKSRTNKAGQAASLVFNQDMGFDQELSLLQLLKDNGRVNGAGAYLYIGGHSDMKFSQKKFKEKLATDPEFMRVVQQEVMDVLRLIIPDTSQEQAQQQQMCAAMSSTILNEMNNVTV